MPCDWLKGKTPFKRLFSFKRRLKRQKTRFENDTETVQKRRFGQKNRHCHCMMFTCFIYVFHHHSINNYRQLQHQTEISFNLVPNLSMELLFV